MTQCVAFTKGTESDLEHIIEYYLLEASEAVARAVSGRIRAGLAELAEFPLRTRSGHVSSTREWAIARLPKIGVIKNDANTGYVPAILLPARHYLPAKITADHRGNNARKPTIRLPGVPHPATTNLTMSFNDIETARIKRAMAAFLTKRRPRPEIRHELDMIYRIPGQSVEVFEVRPAWDEPGVTPEHPVAKATYVRTVREWRIFWMRSDLKWHRYDLAPAVKTIDQFAAIVDRDEACCFFG